jgi:hypothetical protein
MGIPIQRKQRLVERMKKLWSFNAIKPKTHTAVLHTEYLDAGIRFSAPDVGWLETPYQFGEHSERVALLAQLMEEGFAELSDNTVQLPWEALYTLQSTADYQASLALLGLPPSSGWKPKLSSQHGLIDAHFSILLAGWIDENHRAVMGNASLKGAVLQYGQHEALLPEATWQTVRALAEFHHRPPSERTTDSNKRAWAQIRRYALAAQADLSDFLKKTMVLTPERLEITLRKAQFGESKTVEVIPHFAGEPAAWLAQFDAFKTVHERYEIPDGAGLVHILLSPEAQNVLREIKQMPARRVSGERAEAFLRNPIATLGEAAARVIDPAQFEQARADAGIVYARFTAEVQRDAGGLPVQCALVVEESIAGEIRSETLPLPEAELPKFIQKLDAKITQGAQCCFWDGYDLEILGDTPEQLEILKSAWRDLSKRQWLSAAEVFDLSRYADGKIAGFGEEKPYYSPFIARKNDETSWFPDNLVCGLRFVPEGSNEAVDLPFTEAGLEKLERLLNQAKADGRSSFDFPSCPQPIPVAEAEKLISQFTKIKQDVSQGNTPKTAQKPRRGLVLKPNIVKVDYEERRGILALPAGKQAQLPRALKTEFKLKEHQLSGVAWLQHLWSLSPHECRGALLADDMGLGKTVQLLTFIAACLESEPTIEPFLIVAPVSLLENWREEMGKFFMPDTFPLLTLYGADLAQLRAPKNAIDNELLGMNLLRRDWLGNAKVVLTTYETLRDLEFTLAAQPWSAVICDEAQKIKNPNAMMTRAAKKQNVRFKIACTGTPVENSLADLWCLFDFIQPGLLGALNAFGTQYRKPIEAKTDEQKQRVAALRAMIEPQLLRRIKADVAQDLPQKTLVNACLNLPLSTQQRDYYAQAITHHQQSAQDGNSKNHLGLLSYLRRICADPQPMGQQASATAPLVDIEKHSPKMRWLLAELQHIQVRQDKVIVFCELRDVQRLLQRAVLERFNFKPSIINGDTSNNRNSTESRQKQIRAFQEKTGFGVIILSPLAAGFGLNIQAANHVVHFTRHWNPAKEDQATDRAYRIGQKKTVFVYCPLVVAQDFVTFDAKLHRLLESKRELAGNMLNGVGDLSSSDFGDLQNVNGATIFDHAPFTANDIASMMPESFGEARVETNDR